MHCGRILPGPKHRGGSDRADMMGTSSRFPVSSVHLLRISAGVEFCSYARGGRTRRVAAVIVNIIECIKLFTVYVKRYNDSRV